MQIHRVAAVNFPERIPMVTATTIPPTLQQESFLNLNEYLLPANTDAALLVRIDEDSEDFRSGDLLVVDTDKKPNIGDFTMIDEGGSYSIDRYGLGTKIPFGVVTSIIRKL
jgi:SOS-response transcriptional repressor LexA